MHAPSSDLPDIAVDTLERLRDRRPRVAFFNPDRAIIRARARVFP